MTTTCTHSHAINVNDIYHCMYCEGTYTMDAYGRFNYVDIRPKPKEKKKKKFFKHSNEDDEE